MAIELTDQSTRDPMTRLTEAALESFRHSAMVCWLAGLDTAMCAYDVPREVFDDVFDVETGEEQMATLPGGQPAWIKRLTNTALLYTREPPVEGDEKDEPESNDDSKPATESLGECPSSSESRRGPPHA